VCVLEKEDVSVFAALPSSVAGEGEGERERERDRETKRERMNDCVCV